MEREHVWWKCDLDFVKTYITPLTCISLLHPSFEATILYTVMTWVILGVFIVDIVLRIAAGPKEFFSGAARNLNAFELLIVVVCILFELVDTNAPVSLLRLTRPLLRLVPLAHTYMRVFVMNSRRGSSKRPNAPLAINTRCLYLDNIMEHKTGILQYLVHADQPELFESTAVQGILEFKWQKYARNLHIQDLMLYLGLT